jgi:(1->4)-alpha-D-glucan 1-alpha-D-glucosylmutase
MPQPTATYRLQLHAEFGFADASAIADYLHDLGVSHIYISPSLQAGKGSTHGYDVLNHHQLSTDLGGAAGHTRLCEALSRHRLGVVLDIVPNHMSIASRENAWWWDVLENGQASRYASYFDVDWNSPTSGLRNRVLLPILGDHYGRVLEAREFQLVRDGGTITINYHDHVMPVAPRTLDDLVGRAARALRSDELGFLADSLGNLPLSTETDRQSVLRRHRDKEVLRAFLARLCTLRSEIAHAVDDVIAEFNRSPAEIDALLQRQNYRLAFWRTAGEELDYRRFFDINTLVSLRSEEEAVFDDTHLLIRKWVEQGLLDGLRVDHPDGLYNPRQYFERLSGLAPECWIVAEKILEPGEPLAEDWPVAGTTGYDFLNQATGLLIDPAGEAALTDLFVDFTGVQESYTALVRDKKHLVLKEFFASDLARLAMIMVEICEHHKRFRDYTRRELNGMLREVIACFPVYRTYIETDSGRISDSDRGYIQEAIASAKRNRPEIDADLFDFLGDLLQLEIRGALESTLVMRFQQQTGPVMAKGVEDTAFYHYNRFIALNEVGGDPGKFGITPDEFHAYCQDRHARWPTTMLASTTHDTKRSEDVRARLALLSEIPDQWAVAVTRWREKNRRHQRNDAPDRNLEYLLYQTLVGAWPIEQERLNAYLIKAARESKTQTSWLSPESNYEEAMTGFVEALLGDAEFLEDLKSFVDPLIEPGRVNALSQTLIKLTAPGVPDLYQGTELWTLSLVDPDNRRPVDYAVRRRLLAELKTDTLTPEALLARADESLPKLHLTRQALRLRQECPDCYGADAAYVPLRAEGLKASHVVAFARGGETGCLTIAQRLPFRRGPDWVGTTLALPKQPWLNVMTGEQVAGGVTALGDLLGRFPVALLRTLE